MKTIILTLNNKTFYSDHTYRCEQWPDKKYSKWKIMRNNAYFNHGRYETGWGVFTTIDSAFLAQRLNEAVLNLEIEKILLEG